MKYSDTYKPIFEQKDALPKMIQEGLKLYGTLETPGTKSTQSILDWAKECDLSSTYGSDEIPWCGLYAAVVAKRAGKKVVASPLWARSWRNFGSAAPQPSLGDILVFSRPGGGGHVGLYVAEDNACYHVLGGNQSDQVNITRILKTRLLEARRPVYITQPKSVKPYVIQKHGGVISSNEA